VCSVHRTGGLEHATTAGFDGVSAALSEALATLPLGAVLAPVLMLHIFGSSATRTCKTKWTCHFLTLFLAAQHAALSCKSRAAVLEEQLCSR
jgi:hypothetical protein